MSSTVKKRRKPNPSHSSFQPPTTLFPSKHDLPKLFAVIAIATSVAFFCNYAANLLLNRRTPKPFCDNYADLLPDLCEPCPDNGHCSNGKLDCLHGYKKQGRKCVEDGEVNQTVQELSAWVENHVCNAYARVLCDETGKIWFQETDIISILDEHKLMENIILNDGTIVFAKHKVMEVLDSSLDKRAIANGNNEYKCPEVRAETYKPLRCSVRQWIYGHAYLIATLSVLLLGFIRCLWIIRQKQYLSTRAEQLYDQVCEILEDSAMTMKGTDNEHEPWIVASWLRDHLLLPRERKDTMLWKKVEELLQEDSRIDKYPKIIKGESKIVFEWQVGKSLSSKMRAKKAISRTRADSHSAVSTSSNIQQREAKIREFNF